MFKINTKLNPKYLLFFAIFVSPMGAQAFSFPIGGMRMSLFRLLILLILLLFVIQNKKITVKLGSLYSTKFMLSWLTYAIISFFWVIDDISGLKAVFFIFIGVVSMLLCMNYFDSIEDVKKAFCSFSYGIGVQTIIGWYEVVTLEYHYMTGGEEQLQNYIARGLRLPIAMLGNPNDYATLMLFGFFIGCSCYFICNSHFFKIVHLLLAINCAVLLVMTMSRANIIGLFLGIGIFILLIGHKKAFIVTVALLVVLIFSPVTAVMSEVLQFNLNATIGSDITRVGLIKTGLDYFIHSFGFGVGAGQIESWITNFGSDYYVGNISDLHNWWLEILVNYGIIVFIGYALFYTNQFIGNFRTARERYGNAMAKYVSIAICCILTGFTIASVSSSSNMNNEWLWMFWGVCISYEGLREQENNKEKSDQNIPPTSRINVSCARNRWKNG